MLSTTVKSALHRNGSSYWHFWLMKESHQRALKVTLTNSFLTSLVKRLWILSRDRCTLLCKSMNQSKLDMVKQNITILGISELKWMGKGKLNSDDHYIYYCGQERRKQWHPTPVLLPGKSHGWRSLVGYGVAQSRTRLSDFTFTFHFHALENEMATHSSVLAWRIPRTGEPGGLPSMGSHRVGQD